MAGKGSLLSRPITPLLHRNYLGKRGRAKALKRTSSGIHRKKQIKNSMKNHDWMVSSRKRTFASCQGSDRLYRISFASLNHLLTWASRDARPEGCCLCRLRSYRDQFNNLLQEILRQVRIHSKKSCVARGETYHTTNKTIFFLLHELFQDTQEKEKSKKKKSS